MPRLPLPTDAWVRALLAPVLVFIATALDRNYQTDLWHHLARGRAIVEDGGLLDHDRLSFTVPGKAFQDANWLWQVLFYRLYELGGLPLMQAVNSLLLAAAMALLVRLAWRRSGSLPIATAVCVLVFFGLWQVLIVRPQTFSLLLFVLLATILEAAERRRWLLALPPVLVALWANVHGAFPAGVVLVGCYALGAALEKGDAALFWSDWKRAASPFLARTWPWAVCLLACAAATCVNPYGWRIYEFVLLTTRVASARRIDEWLPPGPDLLIGKAWIASLVLLVVLLAVGRRRPAWREVLLVCCFLPLACKSVRMVAWWLLVCAPLLAAQLAALWREWRPEPNQIEPARPTVFAGMACAVMLAAAGLSLPWLERFNPVFALPGRAHRTEADLQVMVDHLGAEGHGGRVFTRFSWGEYLGWGLAPACTVFMDGRIELYPDEVWALYGAVTRGRGDWQQVLDRHGVDYLLLDTAGYHAELLPLVERSPEWRATKQQGSAVLFERRRERVAGRLTGAKEAP